MSLSWNVWVHFEDVYYRCIVRIWNSLQYYIRNPWGKRSTAYACRQQKMIFVLNFSTGRATRRATPASGQAPRQVRRQVRACPTLTTSTSAACWSTSRCTVVMATRCGVTAPTVTTTTTATSSERTVRRRPLNSKHVRAHCVCRFNVLQLFKYELMHVV